MKILLGLFVSVFLAFSVQAQRTVRFMSYNIRHGAGMDNRLDSERIAKVIQQVAPDVVALQEVDSATMRIGEADMLHELADYNLMYRMYAPAIPYRGGKYGIGLLAREKPLHFRYMPLPGREEARVLLIAEFEDYVFCCTHFSLTEEDQLAAVSVLTEELSTVKKPVFLAGDLNALPDSPVLKVLQEKFVLLTNPEEKTFPADKPQECLDYILGFTGNGQTYTVLANRVVKETVASDHRPVVADIRLKTDADRIFRTLPYLQNPVDGGITVSWLTNAPVFSWVEYGTDTLHLQQAFTELDGQKVANNRIHKIRLENLKPGEKYFYRVCSREILSYRAYNKKFGDTAVSGFYTFRLPAPGTTDFTAIVFNDIHNQYETMAALHSQVRDADYDFVIFNGDCFDAPANEEAVVGPLKYYNARVGAQHTSVFYLRGNHEIRNAWSLHMREYWDYMNGKTYGAFNWGDTRFVLLDCGEDKKDDHWVYYGLNDFTGFRNEQAVFLKRELASKAFRKADKRILVHHIPVYGNTDEYQPCTELWGDLLQKAPFNVSLNAHTHQYAFYPKGAAGNNFPVFIGGGYSLKEATVMVLTKKGRQLKIKVINAAGEILKEMEL